MENYYQNLIKIFGDRFISVTKNEKTKIDWPYGFGVYVIWSPNRITIENLIYVGLTGRFARNLENSLILNKGQFIKRMSRWTPYRFCEKERDGDLQFSFRYQPKYKNTTEQGNAKYELDSYYKTVFYDEVLILDFFVFNESLNENFGYTPALLEAEILTKYLLEMNDLPPANNSL